MTDKLPRASDSAIACRIDGEPCERHHGMIHGGEAEEPRRGIEEVIGDAEHYSGSRAVVVPVSMLKRLLDEVDARDSLAFVERR